MMEQHSTSQPGRCVICGPSKHRLAAHFDFCAVCFKCNRCRDPIEKSSYTYYSATKLLLCKKCDDHRTSGSLQRTLQELATTRAEKTRISQQLGVVNGKLASAENGNAKLQAKAESEQRERMKLESKKRRLEAKLKEAEQREAQLVVEKTDLQSKLKDGEQREAQLVVEKTDLQSKLDESVKMKNSLRDRLRRRALEDIEMAASAGREKDESTANKSTGDNSSHAD